MPDLDAVALTRRKVEPMVRGLFPRVEQPAVLSMLERSVVFVTAENIEQLLLEQAFDHSAWNIGNLHLTSVGAGLLGPPVTDLVGISEGTTCFVSPGSGCWTSTLGSARRSRTPARCTSAS